MAQDYSATHLDTSWAASSARVACRVRADWNVDGDYTDTYEDITARVASLSINHTLYSQLAGLPVLGGSRPSTASLQLINEDRWFSPDNGSGLAGTYANLASGIYRIPIMIELGYYYGATPEYLVQFVGEIEGVDESEAHGTAMVVASCTDNSIGLLQYKLSTTITEDTRPDEYMATLLAAAGVGSRDLDEALTEIPFAWLDDENVWSELQELAAADGGFQFMAKDGTATFRRMTAPIERVDSTASQATLNEGNAKAYRDSIAWRDCYNALVSEYAGRYQGTLTELYQAPRPIEVPPGETVTEDARFRYPTLSAITPVYGTDYHAITAAPLTVAYGAGGVQLSMTAYGQRAEIEITNNLTDDTLYITDLVVRGYPLLGDEAQQCRYESALGLIDGEKAYPVRGNPYVQTREQVERVAQYLLDRLERPRRLLQWQGVACPWLELLDRVTLSHNTMTPNPGVDAECYVLGINMAYNPKGLWEQALTLLPCADVYAHDDYFIIGTSVYASGSSDKVAY